jgi:hypothetical protein
MSQAILARRRGCGRNRQVFGEVFDRAAFIV